MNEEPGNLAAMLRSVAQRMGADFQQSRAFKHRGEAGGVRESLVCDFLQNYLPGQNTALHSGEIISLSGSVSSQCDVLIVDSQTPPFTSMQDYRVVPIECVYGTIEVKTRLTKGELINACEKIREIKQMEKIAYYENSLVKTTAKAYGRIHPHFPTVGDIFAFDSIDLDTIGQHLAEWCQGKDCSTVPDGVWILGKGYFQWETEGGQISMRATQAGRLTRFAPWEETDILYPMLMALNINYGESWMDRLKLVDYATSTPLGQYRKKWNVPMR
ncbi:DUF6602 domain-containing protein [Streptomyces sp. NPDC047461]|uniref:DUF6602 domain-containing protein n=1 Tax=Streptomyces sp. NPDC047461 TaxID=3155619 RepID=UPI0033F52D6F